MSNASASNLFVQSPYNPFSNRWVENPRESDISIEDLNRDALERLLQEFESRRQTPGRRPAQLVTSASAGYGKSHLIGRLFQKVGPRATRIYFQPFNDATSPWTSLLRVIIRELTYPDADAKDAYLDQLDALARGVIGSLVGDLFRAGYVEHSEPDAVASIFEDPNFPFGDPKNEWADWLNHEFSVYGTDIVRAMHKRGLRLASEVDPLTYVKILYQYITRRTSPGVRSICLEWLKAKGLEPEEAKRIGIPRRDILAFESTPETINEVAMNRVFDLCQLAGLSRPFLFCFDQTEFFATSEELTFQFGSVIAQLFQYAPNQLTVITANQDAWTHKLAPRIDDAHLDRISSPVSLNGIDRQLACDLARRRLQSVGFDQSAIQSFLERKWLDQVFQVEQRSTRKFLEDCEARFAQLAAQEPPEKPGIEALFEAERKSLLAKKERIKHNSDILQWLIHDVVGDDPDLGFRAVRQRSRNDYFPIAWQARDSRKRIHFGFEDGAHHRAWKAIAEEALSLHRRSALEAWCVILRGHELVKVPKPTWSQARSLMEEASRSSLHVKSLSREKVAGLYAGWELYNRACQADIDYSPDDVLVFLREKLTEWWNRLANRNERDPNEDGPAPNSSHTTNDPKRCRKRIARLIESERFISQHRLMELLESQERLSLSMEEMLTLSADIQEVTVYSHPNQTVFQWRG